MPKNVCIFWVGVQKYNSTDIVGTSANDSGESSTRKNPADVYVYCKTGAGSVRLADGACSHMLPASVGVPPLPEGVMSVDPGDADSDMLSRELAATALDAVSGHMLGSSSRFIHGTGSFARLPVTTSSHDLTTTHSGGGNSHTTPMTARERIHMLASGVWYSPRRGLSDALPDDSVRLRMDHHSERADQQSSWERFPTPRSPE
jgi:hypothetical protein